MTQTITLTTDFGHKGPFVAVVKGVILKHAPDAHVIDLTHEIHVHWTAEAGFWLAHAYHYFPAGSVHVAVVDPGVGTERDIIAADADGHVFLAPDNGILPLVFAVTGAANAFRLSRDWLGQQGWPQPSNTFHGRDIFAPLAGEIAAGRLKPRDVGPPVSIDDIVPPLLEEPRVQANEVRGTVIAIDHFGNLITNIDAQLLTGIDNPQIRAAGYRLTLKETYARAQPGDFLALINSFGVVEIARAEGSAADKLGLGVGAPVFVCAT